MKNFKNIEGVGFIDIDKIIFISEVEYVTCPPEGAYHSFTINMDGKNIEIKDPLNNEERFLESRKASYQRIFKIRNNLINAINEKKST